MPVSKPRPRRIPVPALHLLEPRLLLSQVAFSAPTSYAALSDGNLFGVTAADFNGDGTPDVAISNSANNANSMSVYLSTPSGALAPKVDYPSAFIPRCIASGDFNNDGRPDIAVGGYPGMKIHLNNGDGAFAAGVSYTTRTNNPSTICIRTADFNNDGNLDTIVAGTGYVTTFLGAGDGTFPTKIETIVANQMPRIATGDFNRDGILDLATTYFIDTITSMSVQMGNGDGTFGAAVNYATYKYTYDAGVEDFNGDGNPDIAVSGSTGGLKFGIFINNGDGTFAARVDYTSSGFPMVTGDFNADGKPDALVLADNGGFSAAILNLFINNGDGTFATKVSYPTAVTPSRPGFAAADFNNDGTLDVAFNSSTGSSGPQYLSIVNNLGLVDFAPRADSTLSSSPQFPISADFNHDNLPDLAIPNSSGIAIKLNLGDGNLAAPVNYAAFSPRTIVAVDLNHDSYVDLAYLSYSSGLYALLNNGDGTFASGITINNSSGLSGLAAADFNNDTFPDLAYSTTFTFYVLFNNGNAAFPTSTFFSISGSSTSIAADDFNHDGFQDIAFNSSGVGVAMNTGNSTFVSPVYYAGQDNLVALVAADLNGDNRPDLAAADTSSRSVIVLLNSGTGTFPSMVSYAANTTFNPNALSVGDVNTDGIPDFALTIDSFSAVSLFINNGKGAFSVPSTLATGSSPHGAAIADFNGDGKSDLVVANTSSSTVSLLLNQSPFNTPRLTAVHLRDSNWSNPFLIYLANKLDTDPALGYKIPLGPNQLQPLPWPTLNQVSLTFNQPVTISDGLNALAVTGINNPSYNITNFSYDPAAHTATWTLAQPLAADTLTLALSAAAITDAAGHPLDGDFTDASSFISGNGAPGGNLTFHLNILPGDANSDGIVDGADFDAWFSHLGTSTFNPASGDLNGDGLVDGADFDQWFTHLQQSAPAAASASLTNSQSTSQPLPLAATAVSTIDEFTSSKSKTKTQKSKTAPLLLQKRLFH